MAVEVQVIGNGIYAGARSNIGTYTVSEESTPVEASDTSGGTGQITFTAVDDPSRFGSMLLLNDTIKLTDGERGDTEGKINAITSNDRTLNITADSRLGQLVVDKLVDGYEGTLTGLINYYLSVCNITTGIAIDSTIANISVSVPGWAGDMWTKIKEMCVVFGIEVTLIRGVIVFRPVRVNNAVELNNISESWSISNTDLAQSVEVYYYNSDFKSNTLVYPAGGWNEDVTVYTVDAGQIVEVNIPIDVTLTSITQPVLTTFVSKTSTASSYCVAGNDGLPIPTAQWTNGGGRLSVKIGEDKKSIDVTIVGAEDPTGLYAPYRIAVSSGPSDYYSSLRIRGNGVHFTKQSVVVPTGVDASVTPREIGVTVDNVFIKTQADAFDVALDVACKWASPVRTVNITRAVISAPTDSSGGYNYATFADFDAYATSNGLTTFTLFDAEWSGESFGDFDNYWYDLVDDQFAFQIFGNANGARIQFRRAIYRIRSIQISESNVSYVAEADTTFADFDSSASGMTFSQFDASYSGLTFQDFSLIPLPKVKPEYDR